MQTTLPCAATILCQGMRLPPPPGLQSAPPGCRCALTGEPLDHGYPAQNILPSSTGDPLDVTGGDPHGWLSVAAASVLAGDWNLGGRALFQEADGGVTAFYPRLSPEKEVPDKEDAGPLSSKKLKTMSRDGSQPRPLWRDLVRAVWPDRAGQTCLLLLATDPKKRVWYKARVGTLGTQTPLYLFDNARHQKRPLTLDWPRLRETLDIVEEIYAAGFTKRGIETFLPAETRASQKVGLPQTLAWERSLSLLRPAPEFLVSIIIAQKPENLIAQKPEKEN